MKKLIFTLFIGLMTINACFSLTWLEKMLLPTFTGDITKVEYRVIESSDEDIVIEVNGILYILKQK